MSERQKEKMPSEEVNREFRRKKHFCILQSAF
jgi:hypothetical protein